MILYNEVKGFKAIANLMRDLRRRLCVLVGEMILTSKLLEDTMILLIDEDVKQLQKLSWNCVSRYYCTITPSRKNAKLQTVLLVRVNESQKRIVYE